MKKILATMLFALVTIPFALAQGDLTVSIQEAVAAMPETARVALYSNADQDLVGSSSDFLRTDFKLFIDQAFAGPATMVVEQDESTVHTFQVEVLDGSVMFGDTSFLEILEDAGYENAEVVQADPNGPYFAGDAPGLPEGAMD